MKHLIGIKIGMMQLFDGASLKATPVTVVEARPNVVTQVKTLATDGYTAVQVGYGTRRRTTKPLVGHLKGLGPVRGLREFRVPDAEIGSLKRGDAVTAETFAVGDRVQVTAVSKGRGFAGGVKRHGFHGGPKTHGQKHRHRAPGSIGSTTPQRVLKGTRMAGRMGAVRVTVKGLKIVAMDAEQHRLFISGAVPGAAGSPVIISGMTS